MSLRNLSTYALQGDNIKVSWNGITSPTAYDWVGIYKPGATDSNYLAWIYTDASSSGEKTFPLSAIRLVPNETYELRLFANDDYIKLANTAPFVLLSAESVSTKSEVFYIHNDHLGTPKALTNKKGQVVWRAMATPFGKTSINDDVDSDGVSVEFNIRQPGQYYDSESGLHYNYFRYYDPETGRYITSDPIGIDGLMNALGGDFTGQDMNLYAYVRNNPLKYIDPEGALIQFAPAVGNFLRAVVVAARLYTGTLRAPKPPKPEVPKPPVVEKPIIPPKPPKPPSC